MSEESFCIPVSAGWTRVRIGLIEHGATKMRVEHVPQQSTWRIHHPALSVEGFGFAGSLWAAQSRALEWHAEYVFLGYLREDTSAAPA